MQVSRQALHAGGAGIDDPFAANADSPYRSLGGFQNRMNEGTQGRGGGGRGYRESALVGFSLTMVCALYPLCAILPGNMEMAEDAPRGQGDVLAPPPPAAKEPKTNRA